MSICILTDGSLGIEFWEAEGPESESTIIAMKYFIVPKLEDVDHDDLPQKMDVETDDDSNDRREVKVEEETTKKKYNELCSESDEDSDN